jgi:hypothetical protein
MSAAPPAAVDPGQDLSHILESDRTCCPSYAVGPAYELATGLLEMVMPWGTESGDYGLETCLIALG